MNNNFDKVEYINTDINNNFTSNTIIKQFIITDVNSNEIIGGYQPIKSNDGSYGLWCYWENKVIHEHEIANYIDKIVPEYMEKLNNSKKFKSIPQGSFIVAKPFALDKDEVRVAINCSSIHRNGYNIIYVGGELIIRVDYRPATWDEIVELVNTFGSKLKPSPKVSLLQKIKDFFTTNK